MQVTYVQANGTSKVLDGKPGQSAMDLGVRHGVAGIIAECGGCCVCATCHVHVDPAWMGKLPAPAPMERDTLELAEGADATSRLSCQIILNAGLDGLVLRVAS